MPVLSAEGRLTIARADNSRMRLFLALAAALLLAGCRNSLSESKMRALVNSARVTGYGYVPILPDMYRCGLREKLWEEVPGNTPASPTRRGVELGIAEVDLDKILFDTPGAPLVLELSDLVTVKDFGPDVRTVRAHAELRPPSMTSAERACLPTPLKMMGEATFYFQLRNGDWVFVR